MFEGLGNLTNLFKQAQQMGGRLEQLSAELKSQRATGTAAGGMVEVEVNGLQEVLTCRIDPQLFEQGDRELLEDLIVAATNQALNRAKQLHAEAMKSLTGGMEIPGMNEMLAGLSGGPGGPAT